MRKFQQDLDWHTSAYKYYHSFKILLFLGYTKQAINALCISIEKFLKTKIMLEKNKTEKDIKDNYNHNLKKLFEDSGLDSKEYKIINCVCNTLQYNKIRYEFEITTNNINSVHKNLEMEIIKLSNNIIDSLNKIYKSRVNYSYYNNIQQDRKYKEYFLKRALKSPDKPMRIDFT